MKHLIWISTLLLFLVACSEEESSQTAVEEVVVVEEPVVEQVEEEQDVVEEEVLEVVEESAAEPEADEQAIMLAQADIAVAPQDWQFKEGTHYIRLVPTQPTLGGADKIEVAEFFWYGCPHCYTLEPTINAWAENKPADVRFVRVPATWNPLLVMHGRLYYTEEVLARNGVIKDAAGFREAVFQEYHRRRNHLTSEAAIQKLFERFGVSADEFSRTWNSFEVDQKLRIATDLMRRYGIASVPMVVVNGKYRTGGSEAGTFPKMIEIIDELVARERVR